MSRKRKGPTDQPAWRNVKPCPFCKNGLPDWKDADALRQYTTNQGGIQPWQKTKACARHQRALAQAIKNARHMALLPHVKSRYRNHRDGKRPHTSRSKN